MKKIIALSTLLVLGALGVACGGGDNTNNANRSNANHNANNGPYSNGPLNNTSVGNAANTATNVGVNAVKKVDNAVTGNSKANANTHANNSKK